MVTISMIVRSHGLPAALLAQWRRRGLRRWTPLQQAAWAQGLPGGEDHWLAAAPTSAGKGFLAEVLAARHLMAGERVLWLAPTRALAEAIAATLAETLAPLGLRVLCATAERPEADAPLARGQFDLCVAVPEKAAAWLVRRPHALAGVGLIVADELGLLRDPERGGRLDLLLARIIGSAYTPRRLGLSLPLPNLEALAGWWGGRLLVDPSRPRPLREGVFEAWSGRFAWREAGGGEGSERLLDPRRLERALGRVARAAGGGELPPALAGTAALALELAARGEPTLLFAPTRPLARRLAAVLAEAAALTADPAPVGAARRLARREPGHDHELLARVLARGVGLHHADLSTPARALVEQALAGDRLALAVATPTLAQGLNLSAVNVLHWTPPAGRSGERALERWRWADQGGRAGRLGRGRGPGRSILVATAPALAADLRRRYLEEPPEPLRSRLGPDDLALGVLLDLAGNTARSAENLRSGLEATFASRCGGLPAAPAFDEALAACSDAGLLAADADRLLRLTPLGRAAAAHGLPPGVVGRLREWLADPALGTGADEPLGMLLALSWAAPPGLWPARRGLPGAALLQGVLGWFAGRGLDPPAPLARAADAPEELGPPELAAIGAAGRLLGWIGGEPTAALEARAGWTAGMLARAGEGLGWLARAAAELDLLMGLEPRAGAWAALAARLETGAPPGAEPLAALRLPELGRSSMALLLAEGWATPAVLVELPLGRLARRLGDRALARRLLQAAREALRRDELEPDFFGARLTADAADPSPQPLECEDTPAAFAPLIEIDLQSPGIVRARGRDLRLTPLGYDLLAVLAERPGRVVTRAALYQRLWPEGGPEDQQLDAHRRRLGRALAAALERADPIQVVRGSGFRLDLAEGAVRLLRGAAA